MYIRVKKGGKWGYYDPFSNKAIDCQYNYALNFEGNYAIVRDEKYKAGVIDSDGNTVIPFIYHTIERVSDQVFRVVINEVSCLITPECIFVDENNQPYPQAIQSYAIASKLSDNLYAVVKDYKVGVFSMDKEIIPCSFYSISYLEDGYFIVKESEYRDFGLLNMDGKTVLPLEYKSIGKHNSRLFMGEKYHEWSFFTHDGSLTCTIKGYSIQSVEPIDDDYSIVTYADKTFKVNLIEGKVYVPNGEEEVCFSKCYDCYGSFVNGICEVWKGHLLGFIDIDGKEIVPCEYDSYEVRNGYALLKRSRPGKYSSSSKIVSIRVFSFKDKKFVSDKEYKSISEFRNGLAIAVREFNNNYIHTSSKYVINSQYEEVQAIGDIRDLEEYEKTDVIRFSSYDGSAQYYSKTGKRVFKGPSGQYIEAPKGITDCGKFSEGLAPVRNQKYLYGFMNGEGRMVIPCKFPSGDIAADGFFGGTSRLTLKRDNGITGVQGEDCCYINTKGDFVVDYHNKPIIIKGKGLIFVFPFDDGVARAIDKNGKWGIISPDGKAVSPFEFSYIFPFRDHEAIVKKGSDMGVMRNDGTISVPIKFTNLTRDGSEYQAQEGRLDSCGHFLCNVVLLDINAFDECLSQEGVFIRVKHEGKYGLLDKNGKEIVPCEFNEIGEIENGFVFCSNKENSVLVSKEGTVIDLPIHTRLATCYPGGIVSLVSEDKSKSLITSKGNNLMSNIEFSIEDINYNLIIYSKQIGYRWLMGVMDIIGNDVLLPEFDSIRFDDIPNSFLAVRDGIEQRYDAQGRKVASKDGSLILLDPSYSSCGDYHEGMVRVARQAKAPKVSSISYYETEADDFGNLDSVVFNSPDNEDNESNQTLWGYLNTSGEEVISCQFSSALDFSCGLAGVTYDSFWGYINQSGAFVIARKFRTASAFHNGAAVVKCREGEGIINTEGSFLVSPEYDVSIEFCEGDLFLKKNKEKLYGFIKSDGSIALPFVFNSATPFKDGVSKVTFKYMNNEQYTIDSEGHIVLSYKGNAYRLKTNLSSFKHIGPISDGVACISYGPAYSDSMMGLLSLNGDVLVEPQSKSISLTPDGRWCLRVPYYFNSSKHWSDHNYRRLFLTDDMKCVTDSHGIVIPFSVFNSIQSFLTEDRYVSFKQIEDDEEDWYYDQKVTRYGVVNGHGDIIIPYEYKEIKLLDKNHIICIKDGAESDEWDESTSRPKRLEYEHTYNLYGERVILNGDTEYPISSEYDSYKPFQRNGLAPVMKDGKWGFIDTSMTEIIECNSSKYYWYNDQYCILTIGYKKALVNRSGDYILTPGRYKDIGMFADGQDLGVFEDGKTVVTMDPFYHTEHRSTYDTLFGETHEWEETVYEKRSIDENGRLIIDVEGGTKTLDKKYKWFNKNADGTVSVYDGDNWGLLDQGLKNEILSCEFSKVDSHLEYDVVYGWKGTLVTIFDGEGNKQTELDCDEVYPLSEEYTKFRRLKDRSYKWYGSLCGFVKHEDGKEVFGFEDVGEEGDGLVSVKKDGKWGYVNLDGELVIQYGYPKVRPFIHGRALVAVYQDKSKMPSDKTRRFGMRSYLGMSGRTLFWGMIGLDGQSITPFIYGDPKYVKGTDRRVLEAVYGGIKTYLDLDGHPLSITEEGTIIPLDGCRACGPEFQGGRQLVYNEDGVGVVDETGHLVVDFRDFGSIINGPILKEDGTIEVSLKKDEKHLVRTINEDGCIVTIKDNQITALPFKYVFALEWIGDYIPVLSGDSWGVLDKSNVEVIPCAYKKITIVNGKALAKTDTGVFIIDLNSKEMTEIKCDDIEVLSDGFLLVRNKKTTKRDSIFSYGSGSSKDVITYGLINLEGQFLLDTVYDEISTHDPAPETDEDDDE